jgi:hypothetical protein
LALNVKGAQSPLKEVNMISVERAKELSNLVAVMVEEGNDAYPYTTEA